MSETLWDVERLTENPAVGADGGTDQVEVVEAELQVSVHAPRRQQLHRHDVRRPRCQEFPGGTLFSTTFDASRYYLIVKGVDISEVRRHRHHRRGIDVGEGARMRRADEHRRPTTTS